MWVDNVLEGLQNIPLVASADPPCLDFCFEGLDNFPNVIRKWMQE